MGPLFPGPIPTPAPPDPERAVLLRRPLSERLLDTLRYLAEEIEPRRVGGLGEAQAAGYLAGRLRRVEHQAAVFSFRSDAAPTITVLLALVAIWVAYLVPLGLPGHVVRAASGGSVLLIGLATLLFVDEQTGNAVLSQLLGGPLSQSVVAVKAAASGPRARAVLVAPLDGPPRSASRWLTRTVLALLLLQLGSYVALLLSDRWPWRPALVVVIVGTSVLLLLMIRAHGADTPPTGIHGAGEVAVLVGVAEEVGLLDRTEIWILAAGAGATGDAGVRQFLRRYPFDQSTAIINLDRITNGEPVFATREGVLREYRSDRQLLALASAADAHDVRINAQPRPLWRRTLARLPFQRHLPVITISSQPEAGALPGPDVPTLARCVYLVVGLLHELDARGL